MALPSVSILMPVRNEERFLPAALASIWRQTLKDWELVAVDDGSTDATPDILEKASKDDPRIRVLRPAERGLVPALNAGLEACRARLVARMDADDISHPRRLELQHSFLSGNPAIGLAASAFRHFPRTNIKMGMLSYEEWQNNLTSHEIILRDLFVESPFVHPSVMFRKDVVTAAGGYLGQGWAEDYDLWLRLAADGVRFARLPMPLLFWRDRPERATRTMPEYTAAAFRACKVHYLKQGFLKGIREVALAGAGLEGRAWSRSLKDQGIGVAYWIDVDPKKIGRTLHGAQVNDARQFPKPDGIKILATVGTRGARWQIRRWANGTGLAEGKDYLCVT
jgi:glycosyltransferase involved in cell wall biosynthesis